MKQIFTDTTQSPEFKGDWKVKQIREFASCTAGGTPSTLVPEFWGGSIPWMNSGELHQKQVDEVDNYITENGLLNSSAKLLPTGCVLIGLAGQGRTRGTVAMNLIPLCTNQSIAAILPNSNFVPEYLYHNLHSRYTELRDLSSGGGGRGGLNLTIIGSIMIPFPSISEQHAIATVLSDIDAEIAILEAQHKKMLNLKMAVMQQLLTGQTRLPGFCDEWNMTRLGNHVTFLRNGVNSRAELLLEGRIKYLHYGDVHASKDVYISTVSLPCLPDFKASSLDRLQDGDLIFADASEDISGVSKSVEVRDVGSNELVSGLHTIAARFDKNVLANGFKGFLQFCPPFVNHLRRLAAGTKVFATNRAHIADVELPLPSIPEQVAIATVLSDMEVEIAALEARREKTQNLKRAMMQELLTGKTRLVLPEVSHV